MKHNTPLPPPPPPPTHTCTPIELQTCSCTGLGVHCNCKVYVLTIYVATTWTQEKRKEEKAFNEHGRMHSLLQLIWCNIRTCSDRQTHLAHLSLSCPLAPPLTPECSHGVRHELTQLHLTEICVVEGRG